MKITSIFFRISLYSEKTCVYLLKLGGLACKFNESNTKSEKGISD